MCHYLINFEFNFVKFLAEGDSVVCWSITGGQARCEFGNIDLPFFKKAVKMVIWSFVIFDLENTLSAHYNIKIYFYIIVTILTESVFDFDKWPNDQNDHTAINPLYYNCLIIMQMRPKDSITRIRNLVKIFW